MEGRVGMVAKYLKAGENCGNNPQFDNAQLDLCTVCCTVKKNRKFFRTITGLHRAFRLGVDFYPMDTYPTVFGIGSNYIWIHIQLLKMT